MTRVAVALLPFLTLLAACDASESPAAAPVADAPGLEVLAKREINPNIFSIAVTPASPPESLLTLAKETCGSRDWCQVHVWDEVASAARGFPLTDPEVAAQRFSYSVNRATGHDRGLWDCQRYPATPAESCMAKE